MFASRRVRIDKEKVIKIERKLIGQGKIQVQVGQEVTPEEIVGQTETAGGFKKINLANALSVSPKEVKKYLQKDLHQRIYKGEILAKKRGNLFNREKIVLASSDATLQVLDENTGELTLTLLLKNLEIPAAVYGVVDEIDQLKGKVFIKTMATIIYGICGSGKAREGNILFFDGRGGLLNKNQIPTRGLNHILAGGGLIYKDAIAKAITENISGIITGGINFSDFKGIGGGRLDIEQKLVSDIGVSVVVTEGFGPLPIGEDIYNTLKSFENKFALIDGNRATIILPISDTDILSAVKRTQLPKSEVSTNSPNTLPSSALESEEIKLGQQVRIIAPPFMAEQGKIISIDKSESSLASGLRSNLITIETSSRKIKVPPFNIEII